MVHDAVALLMRDDLRSSVLAPCTHHTAAEQRDDNEHAQTSSHSMHDE